MVTEGEGVVDRPPPHGSPQSRREGPRRARTCVASVMGSTMILGRCLAMDAKGTEAEALAFSDGAITALGDRAHVQEVAGPDAEVIDAAGCTVVPGFIDAHHHVAIAALYSGSVRLVAPLVTDIPSLQAALAEAARGLAPNQWLVAMDWDEARLSERRPPTVAELDDAVPDRPLFALHYTCHRALANSRALSLAGIDASTKEPSGGTIGRGRGGAPNGLLIERGMSRVEALARPDLARADAEGILARMAAHYRALVRVGITRVVDTAVPRELFALYRALGKRGDMLLPTHACPVSTTGYLEEPWDALEGETTGHTEDSLIVGPVKLVFDGAPGCSMCLSWWQALGSSLRTVGLALALGSLDPVRVASSIEPRLGLDVRSGIAIYQQDEADRVVKGAVARGFGVAIHAIGNAAVEVAVGAYASAGQALFGSTVPRIEHASFLDRELVTRMAGGGIAAVVQPAMLTMNAFSTAARIPGLPFKPLRWLLEAGVPLVGSSDYPVQGFDPLFAMRTAIVRENARGVVVDPDQRLTRDEALAMYTRTAASVIGCLDQTGTLEVGKRADLCLVEGFSDDLREARVRKTFVAGRAFG